jgi:hypothetical protein
MTARSSERRRNLPLIQVKRGSVLNQHIATCGLLLSMAAASVDVDGGVADLWVEEYP